MNWHPGIPCQCITERGKSWESFAPWTQAIPDLSAEAKNARLIGKPGYRQVYPREESRRSMRRWTGDRGESGASHGGGIVETEGNGPIENRIGRRIFRRFFQPAPRIIRALHLNLKLAIYISMRARLVGGSPAGIRGEPNSIREFHAAILRPNARNSTQNKRGPSRHSMFKTRLGASSA